MALPGDVCLTSALLEASPARPWAARAGGGYLEGLELTSYLLGEVLAVLAERALLGGLGHGVLELSAQLQEESALLNSAEPAAPPPEGRRCGGACQPLRRVTLLALSPVKG